MRLVAVAACAAAMGLAGCGMGVSSGTGGTILGNVTSVTPSGTGIPLSVATSGNFEYVTVQVTGQIFTYDLSTGVQVQVGTPYATPCSYPSGMVIASIGGANVMAVACYDTGELLTLTVNPDGTLSALGAVGGLPHPYPGIVLDGLNVYVPLYGVSQGANGAVARVNLALPAAPVVTGTVTLASPVPGGFANPGFLALANGYIFVAAGSESGPQNQSSTIQVVRESTMSLVGTPLVVAHSPQHLAVGNGVLYATVYDAGQVESINIANPASLQVMDVLTMSGPGVCNPIPILLTGTTAYMGCYAQGTVQTLDISNPAAMRVTASLSGIAAAQNLAMLGNHVIAVSGETGGDVYSIEIEQVGLNGGVGH